MLSLSLSPSPSFSLAPPSLTPSCCLARSFILSLFHSFFLSFLSRSSTMPLLPFPTPSSQPHHSLFFTNAPCCQPDWPLCAGFANKFRLRLSSDTRRILTHQIVATLINDVKINPCRQHFRETRGTIAVVGNGTQRARAREKKREDARARPERKRQRPVRA